LELRSFEGALESLVEISLVFPVHPSEGLLEEYAFGRLIGSRLNAVEEHLLLCEGCQQACEETEQYIRLMQSAARRLVLEPRRRTLERVWNWVRAGVPTRAWVWAGVLAAGCIVGSVSLTNRFPAVAAPAPLESFRGGDSVRGDGEATNSAPARRPLNFTIRAEDVPRAAEYRIEVVTDTGRAVWTQAVQPDQKVLAAHMKRGLAKGLYWVRLYGDGSQLLTEYGLRLE
jgi:hypothetical protein